MIKTIMTILKKEMMSYFEGVSAWVVLSVYILTSMFVTFFVGGFFSINNSGLFSFFYFQPYIMALLIPSITMRLWAEERKSGTLEFLLTQPISVLSVVIGKYLAAWLMSSIMLLLSIPLWIYLNIYFSADNLNIISGYTGCILITGSFCALGCLISSFCSSPAVSYLWGLIILFCLNVSDFSSIIEAMHLPQIIELRLHKMLSLSSHYYDLINGQVGLDNILYFILIIIICLWLNVMSIDYKKN